jgi:hypothetical protein
MMIFKLLLLTQDGGNSGSMMDKPLETSMMTRYLMSRMAKMRKETKLRSLSQLDLPVNNGEFSMLITRKLTELRALIRDSV